jgi:hypothetical protein
VLLWLAWRYPAWTALLGATVVAILRARPRMALVLAAVAALAVPVLVVVVAQAAGSVGLASTSPAQLERLGELGWTVARSAPEAGLVAAALGLALVARDPRAAIAAIVLVAPGLARALEQRAWLARWRAGTGSRSP